MTALTFTPASSGGWFAVASGDDVVLLDPSSAARVGRVWDAVGSAGAFETVIRLLAEDGFGSLPEFAVLEWSGDHVRAIVRGAVSLEVDDADGTQRQDGRGVSTWTERGFDGVTAIRLSVSGAVPLDGAGALPLASGSAIVAACTVTADEEVGDRTVVVDRARRRPTPAAQAPQTLVAPPAPPAPPAPKPLEESTPPAPEPVAESGPPAADLGDVGPAESDERVTENTVSDVTLSHVGATGEDDEATGDETDDDPLSGDTVYVPRKGRARAAALAPIEETVVPATATGPVSTEAAAMPTAAVLTPHFPQPAVASPATPAASSTELGGESGGEVGGIGDHDGLTVVGSGLPKGRGPRPARTGEKPAAAQAVAIVLPSGAREALDQPLIVGRAPSATQVSGASLPRLVTVGGADQDISRTHVRFALEGDSVVVTDLHSRNGTLVVLPGKPPQKLRAGEPTTVVLDTVVDLGGGITLTVEAG